MSEQHCKISLDLLPAKHFISLATGKPIALNAMDKILWAWSKKRHDFFTKELGNPWFDNQIELANACGCSESTVKRSIGKMIEHGYLIISGKLHIHGGAFSNSMTITQDLILAPVVPLKATAKPVVVVVAPEHECVPEYAAIVLPNVAKARTRPAPEPVMMPPVQDMDDEGYDDAPPWMRGAA
jgi:hypothetical protein